MAVAADLEEAAFFALDNVSEKQQGGSNLRTLVDTFLLGFFPLFVDSDEAQRTVLNWGIPFIEVQQTISPVLAQQSETNVPSLGDVLSRTMFAGNSAEIASRISTAQGVALLTLYNTVWG